jgi:hypothetical protein
MIDFARRHNCEACAQAQVGVRSSVLIDDNLASGLTICETNVSARSANLEDLSLFENRAELS